MAMRDGGARTHYADDRQGNLLVEPDASGVVQAARTRGGESHRLPMRMGKRVLLAAALSWGFAVTLGLLNAAVARGSFSLATLTLPAVVPVALIG